MKGARGFKTKPPKPFIIIKYFNMRGWGFGLVARPLGIPQGARHLDQPPLEGWLD